MAARKVRLLLIEDDAIDRELVRRHLKNGYEIVEAATAQQGIELAETEEIDCVLVDYRLPDANGITLIDIFYRRDLPILVLTGEENPAVIVEAMQRGAEDYLVKSGLTKPALDYAIQNAIEKTRMRHELREKQTALVRQAELLQEQNRKIRALASELTLAEQRERRRIAQILHDDLQQTIHGISVRRHIIHQNLPAEIRSQIEPHLTAMDELIEAAISSTRSLSTDLSPPTIKNVDLTLTLEWLAGYMQRLHGLEISLDFQDECQITSEDLRVLIFQLVRELLFNIVKHAGVRQASLTVFERDERLHIQISDQGKGFDLKQLFGGAPGRPGFGLYSVKERIELFDGRLEIESSLGQGTTSTIVIPKESGPTLAKEEHAGSSQVVAVAPAEENFECEDDAA
ncbi:MAG TPA: response regulator [Anaerolineae bacterium]|nr:response regulator [Anaerolineae bacterium]